MHRRRLILAASSAALILGISGCGKQQTKSTEQNLEPVKPIMLTERQTETESTEKQTETESETEEKEQNPKDVLVKVNREDRSGIVKASIQMEEGNDTVNAAFQSNRNAVGIQDEDGRTIYSDKNESGFYDGKWIKVDASFADMWKGIYKAQYVGKSEVDGKECFQYDYEIDDTVMPVAGMLCFDGITNFITGTTEFSYFVDPSSGEVMLVKAQTSFRGEKKEMGSAEETEGSLSQDETESQTEPQVKDVSGTISVEFIPQSTDTVSLNAPDIPENQPVTEKQEKKEHYKAGLIDTSTNVYQNSAFGIQIAGKHLFFFFLGKTAEMDKKYNEEKNGYTEECYGTGDDFLVNCFSQGSEGAEKVLQKYLEKSGAENIEPSDDIQVGDLAFKTKKAVVNNAPIKAYAAEKGGRTFIMTAFYKNEDSVSSFESHLFTMDEDPTWEEDTAALGGYSITTPKGFRINYGKSGDSFVEFDSGTKAVNVFLVSDGAVDTEVQNETTSDEKTVRETEENEQIQIPDGTMMTYLKVKNTEKGYSYYTYVGIIQKDTDVIKYYAVSSSDKENYRQVYTDFAEKTAATQQETQVSETTLSETQAQQ